MTASSQAAAANHHHRPGIHSDLVETLFGSRAQSSPASSGASWRPARLDVDRRQDLSFFHGLHQLPWAVSDFLIAHARTPLAQRRRDAKKWERVYALGGVGFMSAVGCAVALIFFEHKNGLLSSYSIISMMSGIGGLAGHNAGRPLIVLGQVVGLAAARLRGAVPGRSPLLGTRGDFGAAHRRGELHLEISKRESQIRVAQRTAASLQRQRFVLALDSMAHGLCMGDANTNISVVTAKSLNFLGSSRWPRQFNSKPSRARLA